MYLFTSESVSEGHPDKVADQISDALLDQFLAYDEKAHCAIETIVTTGQVVIMGEVSSKAYIDLQAAKQSTALDILNQNTSSTATRAAFSQQYTSSRPISILVCRKLTKKTREPATRA